MSRKVGAATFIILSICEFLLNGANIPNTFRQEEVFDLDARRVQLFDAIDLDNAESVLNLINYAPAKHRNTLVW